MLSMHALGPPYSDSVVYREEESVGATEEACTYGFFVYSHTHFYSV